jgi:hypothetical protein
MRVVRGCLLVVAASFLFTCATLTVVVIGFDRDVYLSTGEDVIALRNYYDGVRYLGLEPLIPRPENRGIFVGPYPEQAALQGPLVCDGERKAQIPYGLGKVEVWTHDCPR